MNKENEDRRLSVDTAIVNNLNAHNYDDAIRVLKVERARMDDVITTIEEKANKAIADLQSRIEHLERAQSENPFNEIEDRIAELERVNHV